MEASPKCHSPTALPREELPVTFEIEAGWAAEPVFRMCAWNPGGGKRLFSETSRPVLLPLSFGGPSHLSFLKVKVKVT